MKHSSLCILFILFITCSISLDILYAQEIKISITNIEAINNKLIVSYDFSDNEKAQYYDVWIEVTTLQGTRINARTLTGDVGDHIKAGKEKKIVWDFGSDEIVIDEEVNIEVKALPSRKELVTPGKISRASAILKSAVLPGWGLSELDKRKPYWLMGVGTYLLAGGSVLLNQQAYKEYNSYKSDFNQGTSDDSLKKSKSFDSMSKIAAYTAIGVWTINMVWTIIKTKKNNPVTISLKKNKKVSFYTYYDFKLRTQKVSINYSF